MRRSITAVFAVSALFAGLAIASPAQASSSGISQLIQVAQAKSENSNDQAQQGANEQRDMIRRQQNLRARQRALENTDQRGALRQGQAPQCRVCIASQNND